MKFRKIIQQSTKCLELKANVLMRASKTDESIKCLEELSKMKSDEK